MDALGKALVGRGHELLLSQRFDGRTMRYTLSAIVRGRPITLSLVERMHRVVQPPNTKAPAKANTLTYRSTFDMVPAGTFALTIDGLHGAARRRWTDAANPREPPPLADKLI